MTHAPGGSPGLCCMRSVSPVQGVEVRELIV